MLKMELHLISFHLQVLLLVLVAVACQAQEVHLSHLNHE